MFRTTFLLAFVAVFSCGITLGGAAVAADGSWTAGKPETVAGVAGAFTSVVRAGSAALVNFSGDKMVRVKP